MKKTIAVLNEFLENSKVSASALARAIGVNSGAISQFRKGAYKGNNELLANKIAKYIKEYAQKCDEKGKNGEIKDEIFRSRDFKMAEFVIKEAINEKEIALIYGVPGSGKTTILKEFAKNYPNSVLIEVTPHTNARILLDDILKALKIESPRAMQDKIWAIVRFLRSSDKIILIDEAEHLPLRALEDLRRIYDFSNTPVILCGTEILLNNLMGKGKELKQLYSRICGKYIMQGLSKEESKECFKSDVFAYTKGNFRSSAKLHKKAKRLSEHYGCEIDNEILKEAIKMLVLE